MGWNFSWHKNGYIKVHNQNTYNIEIKTKNVVCPILCMTGAKSWLIYLMFVSYTMHWDKIKNLMFFTLSQTISLAKVCCD
jgi:hypothetical protein